MSNIKIVSLMNTLTTNVSPKYPFSPELKTAVPFKQGKRATIPTGLLEHEFDAYIENLSKFTYNEHTTRIKRALVAANLGLGYMAHPDGSGGLLRYVRLSTLDGSSKPARYNEIYRGENSTQQSSCANTDPIPIRHNVPLLMVGYTQLSEHNDGVFLVATNKPNNVEGILEDRVKYIEYWRSGINFTALQTSAAPYSSVKR